MTLHPLDPSQLDTLHRLERATFGERYAWSPAQLASLLARPDAVALGLWGALAPGQAADLVGAALGWCAGPVGELQRIAVLSTQRRGGHGRRLLDRFLGHCRDRGAQELWLEVRADNLAALGLYRAAGFVETGRRSAYYTDGADAVLMSAELAGSTAPVPGR